VPLEGTWIDPDQPRPRQMVDAALDVIEALLGAAAEEASYPSNQAKKIARLARQLRP
jgi:hypothetical protein